MSKPTQGKRGRPRNETESVNLTVTISPALKRKIDNASEKYKTSLSGIVRMALEQWLSENGRLIDDLTVSERLEAFGAKVISLAYAQFNLVEERIKNDKP